jgi:hypothetical protein
MIAGRAFKAAALAAGLVAGLQMHPVAAHASSAPTPVYDTYTVGSSPPGPSHMPPPVSDAAKAEMQLKPLVADGVAPAVTTGIVNKGASFFSVGVKHGVTGVLKGQVVGHGWFLSDKPLPIGQQVYGIPMAGSGGEGIVWCAPRSEPGEGGRAHWTAVCLPHNDANQFAWIVANPALMTLDLSWPYGLPHVASEPIVDRRPVVFPPMTLSYAFDGWNKQHWFIVDVQIDWGEGPQTLRSIAVPPAADGAASLKVMGGEIALRQTAVLDQISVELRSPPNADAAIAY